MKNRETLKWIYQRIRRYFPLVLLISLTTALSAVSGVLIALITKRVFDAATSEGGGSLFTAGALLFAVIIFQVLLSAAQSLLNAYASGKLTVSIRDYLFKRVCEKRYSDISAYHSGDLLNRFTSDTDVIVSSAVSVVPGIVSIITKIIAGVGAMLLLNPLLAAVVLLLGVSVPAVGRLINKKYKKLHREVQKTEGEVRSFLQECFENIVVIKTFVSELPFTGRLGERMDKNFRIKMKRTGITVFSHICLYSFFTLGYYAVMLWGAGGLAAGGPARHAEDHVPVQPQVQRHEHNPPVGRRHVQKPCKGHPARNRQKREHMVREHDAADHQPQHRRQHQQVDDQLKHPGGGVAPFAQAAPPAGIQDVMGDEQCEHPRARPFVGDIAPPRVAHQKQQGQRHGNIQDDFQFGFGVHGVLLIETVWK